ncbi:hypothetical protein B566_EDAN013658 [Ephemera danica]|nr:hypothetical protein B566_EDAN013658 [Ephemera danica]
MNVTEESQLRCQPAAEIPMVLWASAGAAALILVIILIVIAIYCHRRNHGAAVVTEEIGFVTINDRRVPVNPVTASPTSVDAGMENDLYGAYNGPRNEEVEENELYGAFDGAKNELQMQDDDNVYMNYSGPGDEQMEENECYGAYQGPRRKH